MSRDKRGNGIQEVVSSILIGFTNSFINLRDAYPIATNLGGRRFDKCSHSSRRSSAILGSATAEILGVIGNVSIPACTTNR